MKRDMDLIRRILLEMEANQNPDGGMKIEARGYSDGQIAYHLKLLKEAGLIHAIDTTSFQGMSFIPLNITWRGHEFIEATRNEGVWQKLKAELKDRGMSLPFQLIEALAVKIVAESMGLK